MFLRVTPQALERDLTAPRYVWITYGWYQEGWWREGTNSVCSNNQLAGIVERGLALQLFPQSRHPEAMTDTGLVGVHIRQASVYVNSCLYTIIYNYRFAVNCSVDVYCTLFLLDSQTI